MASDWGADRDHGGGVVGWWVLAQALVRAVVIDLPCGFRTVANGFAMPRAAFFCTLARSR
jgi:hypothetical protein